MRQRSKRRADVSIDSEVVLPSQFFSMARSGMPRQAGECHLLVAVLADAVECYQKYQHANDSMGRRLFRDAEDWIMAEAPSQRMAREDEISLSFEYICDILGINAGHVRYTLRRWSDQRAAEAS